MTCQDSTLGKGKVFSNLDSLLLLKLHSDIWEAWLTLRLGAQLPAEARPHLSSSPTSQGSQLWLRSEQLTSGARR